MNDLRDLRVIVTGGASGIGRATAEMLIQRDAQVMIVDLYAAAVEEAVAELSKLAGPTPLGTTCDVRRADDVQRMLDDTISAWGAVDALVHSAGILRPRGARPRPLVDIDDDEYDVVVGTNLHGTFLVNRAVLAYMVANKQGQIINIASTSGLKGRAFDSVYSASKAGVIGLSQAAAEEVKSLGIRIQVVLPDAVDTPIWQQNGPVPAPPGALSPDRVAQVIVLMLALPADATCEQMTVSPLSLRKMRSKSSGATT